MHHKLVAALPFLLTVVWTVSGRGPHHPRGEGIARQHVHYRPTKDHKLTQDESVLHDKEHIQEHLSEVIDHPDLSNLTDDELEFYYFQFHDTDKNLKLDGLEILQAIQHTDHHVHEDGSNHEEETRLDQYFELIDRVLAEDDVDDDGYLSYPEYVAGKKKEHTNSQDKDGSVELVDSKPSVQLIKK